MVKIVLINSETENERWLEIPPVSKCNIPHLGENQEWKYHLKLEIHKWLKSFNIEYRLFSQVNCDTDSYEYGIQFFSNEDAMLFKLAWG